LEVDFFCFRKREVWDIEARMVGSSNAVLCADECSDSDMATAPITGIVWVKGQDPLNADDD